MRQRLELMEIEEGKARAYIPRLKPLGMESGYEIWDSPVFYNPAMRLNRDLSVLALQAFQKEHTLALRACEPLAGSGIRGIRWAKEVEGLELAVLNDANPEAYKLMQRNVLANRVADQVELHHSNANLLLHQYASQPNRFDAIDLDPFGSPMPFLHASFIASKRHSLLAVTATDTAPLCGVKPEACKRKYAAKPLRTGYAHEVAVRILIGAAARIASVYEFGVAPLFTHSTDHYFRCYLELKLSVKHANSALKNIGYLYHCPTCEARGLTTDWEMPHQKCERCSGKLQTAGPLWSGPIQQRNFTSKLLKEAEKRYGGTHPQLTRLLKSILDECIAPALYYDLDEFCDRLGTPNPAFKKLFEQLSGKGYAAYRTHFKPKAIKTEAPPEELEDAIRSSV